MPPRMLRVLHINDYLASGGAEVLVERLVELQRNRGHDARLFTSEDVRGHRRTPLSYISNGRACRALRAYLRGFEPQVIHLHNWYHELSPAILSEIARLKKTRSARVIMTAHDHHLLAPNSSLCYFDGREGGARRVADVEELGRIRYLISHRWDERSPAHSLLKLAQFLWHYRVLRRLRAIDRIIAPSRYLARLLARAELPATFVPPPAPAPATFERARPGDLRFIYAGRVEPEKGISWLLSHVPVDLDFTMTIVGDGLDLDRCRAICERRDLARRVLFAGRLSHEETLEAIASAHVLVLPTLGPEAAGLALLEALALGTNVLTTRLGGQAELVAETKIGYTFALGSADELRSAMAQIAEAHALGRLNAFDASQLLLDRSEERFIDRVLEAYGIDSKALDDTRGFPGSSGPCA